MSQQQASQEMLIGACAAHGLARTGTQEELQRRLGDFLVAQLLFGEPKATNGGRKRVSAGSGSSSGSSATSPASGKRPATAWQAFQRTEKQRVKDAGFTGRVDIVKEIARRWKLFKNVGTSNAPLMLEHSSEDTSEVESVPDGLVMALADLSAEELDTALQAHGIEDTGDHETKVANLARAMLA